MIPGTISTGMRSEAEQGRKLMKDMELSELPPWAPELNPAGDFWKRVGCRLTIISTKGCRGWRIYALTSISHWLRAAPSERLIHWHFQSNPYAGRKAPGAQRAPGRMTGPGHWTRSLFPVNHHALYKLYQSPKWSRPRRHGVGTNCTYYM